MNEIITSIHHEIYTSRGMQLIELERKKFKDILKILDTLVSEPKKTDEKVMGF